jgi:hypothetical protein
MNQKISEYLYEKGNITKLIIYTALFALVFINIYQPFDSRNWFPISEEMFLVFSSLVILTGVLVVLISRVIMYHYARRNGLFFWQYALWILVEIFAMAMFYTLFQSIILDDKRLFSDMLRQSIINTSLVLLLPYSILWLYFALKDRNKRLATLSNKEMEEGHSGKQMFNFRDEKKDLRFSVVSEQVLWIEAADNYVKIHYQNKGKPATFMVRNTLKKIEDDFFSTTLVRCNRSVIVNFDRVKILRKEQGGFFLSLDSEAAPDILVSKTYADKVLMRFSEQYSG